MYKLFLRFAWRHWPISTLTIAGLLALGFQLLHLNLLAQIILALTAGVFALLPLIDTYTRLQTGQIRLNILLTVLVTTALLQHEYWIAYSAAIVYYISTLITAAAQRRATKNKLLAITSLNKSVAVVRGRKIIDTAVSDLHIGDKMVWSTGMIIAVNVQIIENATTSNESGLGGATQSVPKSIGDIVLSGSRNDGQPVTVKVLQTVEDSYLQVTTGLLNKSVGDQTKFVASADSYSLYLTLSGLLIAAAAWYLGHDSQRFLAVLTLATAAPVLVPARLALKTALNKAANDGILFRSGVALQTIVEAQTMAFGFSGVITDGQPTVKTITALKPYTKNEILGLAASLEQASDHPLARAIITETDSQGFDFIHAKHVQAIPGQGLKASLQGKEILVGSASLLTEHGVQLTVKVPAKNLVAYVAHNGQLAGTISFHTQLQPSAAPTFKALRKRGVRWLHILSNAPHGAIEAVAESLGVVDIHADASIAKKLAVMAAVSHRPIAYVGNISTDSTLLTAADVGIGLGLDGSTAVHGSSITVLRNDIAYVAVARQIAQRAFNIAKLSILIGTILSLGLMLVAMSGTIPLLVGLGLQLVINISMAAYPLLALQKS